VPPLPTNSPESEIMITEAARQFPGTYWQRAGKKWSMESKSSM